MTSLLSKLTFFLFAVALVATGCNASKTAKGGVIGGAAGGVIGGAIGKNNGSGTKGAVIGSVVGGAVGAVVGDYMDRQAEEIEREIPGATVDKVATVDSETGETVTESITVTFDSGVLFEFGSYNLTTASRLELDRMAQIFNRYPDTDINIAGHTDSKGTDSFNQTLSEQRAASVADYLASDGIARSRMRTIGYGESRPVASNDTEEGRAANRRVEVSIEGTDRLRQKAENGTLNQGTTQPATNSGNRY